MKRYLIEKHGVGDDVVEFYLGLDLADSFIRINKQVVWQGFSATSFRKAKLQILDHATLWYDSGYYRAVTFHEFYEKTYMSNVGLGE